MTKIRFEKVSIKVKRRWKDSHGRTRQATKEFWQTISPFNVDANGEPKSREVIQQEILAESRKWVPDAE